MRFPHYVQLILARLWESGYEAYAVGGCVRDSLLGREPHDWDIASSAPAEAAASIFSGAPFCVYTGTGLRHGTVTVSCGTPGENCEVTTFRRDGAYTDHRRPDAVTFVSSAVEDLARRDFTINAMAASPSLAGRREVLLDPFGGRSDLAAGVIRCVGTPEVRFSEDALRILRALRFASRFGFRIEEKTAGSMHALAALLDCIAPERLGSELSGILAGDGCCDCLTQFGDIFQRLLPGCRPAEAAEAAARTSSGTLRLAILCLPLPEQKARARLLRMAFGRAAAERVLHLCEHRAAPLDSHAALCRVASAFGQDGAAEYFAFRRALTPDDRTLAAAEAETAALFRPGVCRDTSTLAVSGSDLLRAGVRPGPALGRLLSRLTQDVIEGRLPNDREALLAAANAPAADTGTTENSPE